MASTLEPLNPFRANSRAATDRMSRRVRAASYVRDADRRAPGTRDVVVRLTDTELEPPMRAIIDSLVGVSISAAVPTSGVDR
jgi:hypothetical protein